MSAELSNGTVTIYHDDAKVGGTFPRAGLRRQMFHYGLSDHQLDLFEIALDGLHYAWVDISRPIHKFSCIA